MSALRASGEDAAGGCRPITLAEARRIPPIPSGYRTNRVYELVSRAAGDVTQWELRARAISWMLSKPYDNGVLDDWLQQYEEAAPLESLRFLAVPREGKVEGLLTWRQLLWNDTLWLIDIRVAESSRRQGLGTSLVAGLKEVCRGLGARGVHVETQTTNYPAVSFYHKCGFRVSGFNFELYPGERATPEEVGLFLFWRSANGHGWGTTFVAGDQ